MSSPMWFRRLQISAAPVQSILSELALHLHDEAKLRRCFRLHDAERAYYIVSGAAFVASDDGELMEASSLCPDITVRDAAISRVPAA